MPLKKGLLLRSRDRRTGKLSIKRLLLKLLHGKVGGIAVKALATGITNAAGAFVNQWLGVPPSDLHGGITIATWWLIDKLMLHHKLRTTEEIQKALVARGADVDVDRWLGAQTVTQAAKPIPRAIPVENE